MRRGVLVALGALCVALLAAPGPATSAEASGPLGLFLLLIVLNIALGRATQRMATATDDIVDERQEQTSNRAHRIAYAILSRCLRGSGARLPTSPRRRAAPG